MPNPGEATTPLSPEDAYLDLLTETLEGLDRPARGQFLQRYLKAVAQLDFTEQESIECWDRILTRRNELAETLGKPVSLKTAMVDVLASSRHLRVPILMEYEALKKLQINAATDPLTGLYNRRLFEENFERELNRARRYDHKLVLVILDLHQFKEVNDRHGHLRGDQVLQSAAETLRKSLRTSDHAFRIGGDEFALLLPEADAEQALTLSRRVRANFGAKVVEMRLGISVDVDFGAAVYPEDGDQKDTLIRVADERLYRQKLSGREVPPQERKPEAAPIPAPAQPPREQPPAQQPMAPRGRGEVPPAEKIPAPQERAEEPRREVAAAAMAAEPERRRWERVSLAGTHASAALADGAKKSARILDLCYGGVALETIGSEELSELFSAVLNVPILPPVRVSLKRVYVKHRPDGTNRIGCSFSS